MIGVSEDIKLVFYSLTFSRSLLLKTIGNQKNNSIDQLHIDVMNDTSAVLNLRAFCIFRRTTQPSPYFATYRAVCLSATNLSSVLCYVSISFGNRERLPISNGTIF